MQQENSFKMADEQEGYEGLEKFLKDVDDVGKSVEVLNVMYL